MSQEHETWAPTETRVRGVHAPGLLFEWKPVGLPGLGRGIVKALDAVPPSTPVFVDEHHYLRELGIVYVAVPTNSTGAAT